LFEPSNGQGDYPERLLDAVHAVRTSCSIDPESLREDFSAAFDSHQEILHIWLNSATNYARFSKATGYKGGNDSIADFMKTLPADKKLGAMRLLLEARETVFEWQSNGSCDIEGFARDVSVLLMRLSNWTDEDLLVELLEKTNTVLLSWFE
jgi:hypothetical protein